MTLPMQHPVVRPNTTGRRRPEDPQVSWRERLQALRHLPRLLRMVWDTEPRYVVGILLLRIARALVPLAVLWIGKLIVDEVVQAVAVVGAGGADSLGAPRRAARAGAGHRAGGRGARAGLRAAGEPAGRSLRQPHQRRADAPLRDARPGAVRERRDLRQAGAGPAADGGPHRAVHPAARDHPGPDHPGDARRGAGGLRAVAAAPARRRGAAVAAGRDPLRLAGLLAALLLDARAAPARLPALHRRQRHLRQGAQALRPLRLPGRTVRPPVAGVLRGQQVAGDPPEPGVEPAGRGRHARLLRGVRGHHLSHGDRATGRRPACSPSACSRFSRAPSARAAT